MGLCVQGLYIHIHFTILMYVEIIARQGTNYLSFCVAAIIIIILYI